MKKIDWINCIFAAGQWGVFTRANDIHLVVGKLERYDSERAFKYLCSDGTWYEIFEPIEFPTTLELTIKNGELLYE